MDCFQDRCLFCDRDSPDGPYCSQQCRISDLEKARLSYPASPTDLRNMPYTNKAVPPQHLQQRQNMSQQQHMGNHMPGFKERRRAAEQEQDLLATRFPPPPPPRLGRVFPDHQDLASRPGGMVDDDIRPSKLRNRHQIASSTISRDETADVASRETEGLARALGVRRHGLGCRAEPSHGRSSRAHTSSRGNEPGHTNRQISTVSPLVQSAVPSRERNSKEQESSPGLGRSTQERRQRAFEFGTKSKEQKSSSPLDRWAQRRLDRLNTEQGFREPTGRVLSRAKERAAASIILIP